MKRFYKFHGLKIRIDAQIKEAVSMFEKTFAPKRLKKPCRPDIAFLIMNKAQINEASVPKKIVHRFTLKRERNIEGIHDGRKLYLSDGSSRAVVDYRAREASLYICPSTLRLGKLFTHNFLSLVMIELLKLYGFFYVHASCARIRGKGIMFFGKPAQGKTTACYSLVREGAGWVSDDAVLLKKSGEKIYAYSYIKEFSLETGPKALFEELKKIPGKKNLKTQVMGELNLDKLFKNRTCPRVFFMLADGEKEGESSLASNIIGRIINQNEFMLLDKRFSNLALDILEELLQQCKIGLLKDKNLVLDSEKFYSFVYDIAK